MVLGGPRFCGRADLCLKPRLDDIERACDNTSKTTSCRACEKLEGGADFATLLVLASPSGKLLPEHELQSREWKITVEGSLVAVKQSRGSFQAHNGAGSVHSTAVVVS